MKLRILCLLAALLLPAGAWAATADGTTAANVTTIMMTQDAMTVDAVHVTVGQTVQEGDVLMTAARTSVYCPAKGTVDDIQTDESGTTPQTTVTITPEYKYMITCTARDETTGTRKTLHIGETLYVFCTEDSTHQAVARVVSIDGTDYQAEVYGGELSIGETVYLYRSDTEQLSKRVGIGTVLQADDILVKASGTVDSLAVSVGDTVWRGQLLLKTRGKDETIRATADGIITALNASAGGSLASGQTAAELVMPEDIIITMSVQGDDSGSLHIGDRVTFTLNSEDDEVTYGAVVETKSSISTSDAVTVTLRPEKPLTRLGMTATVQW